jgi:hypothetical protein
MFEQIGVGHIQFRFGQIQGYRLNHSHFYFYVTVVVWLLSAGSPERCWGRLPPLSPPAPPVAANPIETAPEFVFESPTHHQFTLAAPQSFRYLPVTPQVFPNTSLAKEQKQVTQKLSANSYRTTLDNQEEGMPSLETGRAGHVRVPRCDSD